MIIIGLLIGGIFGGMKLVDNANVQKTIQDLKSIESAALTFKDTYRALPGDIRNPSARIPNCTDAPCTTSGDGNRTIDGASTWGDALTATSERFLFWHHIQAFGSIALDFHNTTDMNFGEGQPSSEISGGYRILQMNGNGWYGNRIWSGIAVILTNNSSAALTSSASTNCQQIQSLDKKIDDGLPNNGALQAWNYCATGATTDPTSPYVVTGSGDAVYDLKGL